jgi:hypothetical protein
MSNGVKDRVVSTKIDKAALKKLLQKDEAYVSGAILVDAKAKLLIK